MELRRKIELAIAFVSTVVMCGPMVVAAYESPTLVRISLTTAGCICVAAALFKLALTVGKYDTHMDEYPMPVQDPAKHIKIPSTDDQHTASGSREVPGGDQSANSSDENG